MISYTVVLLDASLVLLLVKVTTLGRVSDGLGCFSVECCEGEGELPRKGQAEEREEQDRRKPLLRKEKAPGCH